MDAENQRGSLSVPAAASFPRFDSEVTRMLPTGLLRPRRLLHRHGESLLIMAFALTLLSTMLALAVAWR